MTSERGRATPLSPRIPPPMTPALGPLSDLGGVSTKACDSEEYYCLQVVDGHSAPAYSD